MDRFDAMAAFIAVTDLNGFAPAARKLGLSTSAVTRHVAALEDRLGVRLLNRTTRAVSLTDAGMRYLERSRRILSDLEDADQMAGSERGEPLGRLVVSAPQVFGRLHVAPLVCAFMTRHPKITAELLLSDRMVNLVEDGVDLAVRIGNLTDSSDIARKVGAVRRILVASPDYLAAQGMPRSPFELSEHHLIAFTSLARPDRWSFWSGDTQHDVQVRPRFVTNSADAAIWHALQGGGLTLALSYQVADQVRGAKLRVVLEDFEPQPYPVQIVYPNSRLLSLKVRAFLEQAVATQEWNFLDLAAA